MYFSHGRPLLFCAWMIVGGVAAIAQSNVPAGACFVMSHFKSDESGGDERLYISTSVDGLNWTALNSGNPVWQPDGWAPFGNVVRDPTIIYDNGSYWVAYTSGTFGHHASFGLVKSTDLLNWTFVGEVSTALPGQTDPLTWNPCFFRDGDGSVHLFVSVSPTQGSEFDPVPGMRSYEMHPISSDWKSWSVPASVDLPSTNTNELWVWKEGRLYHAIYVDFAQSGAQVHVTSAGLLTGWQHPQTLGFRTQEGGFVLKFPRGGYRLYLEPGNSQGSGPLTTYLVTETDPGFSTFTAQVAVQSSIGMRNGKPTAIPNTTTYNGWIATNLGGRPAQQQAPLANPSGDGLSNALDYAFDINPAIPELSYAPHASADPATAGLQLTFRQDPALSDVSYAVESSPDLTNWSSGAGNVEIDSSTLLTDGALETVARSLAPANSTGANYVRMRVTISAPFGTSATAYEPLGTAVQGGKPSRELGERKPDASGSFRHR